MINLVFALSPVFATTELNYCLKSLKEFKAAQVHTRWTETTMDDGKPLIITVQDGDGATKFTAVKAGEIWLNGDVCISKDGKRLTLKNTKATSNVPFLARQALPSQQTGEIKNGSVHLGGIAWSGTFQGSN